MLSKLKRKLVIELESEIALVKLERQVYDDVFKYHPNEDLVKLTKALHPNLKSIANRDLRIIRLTRLINLLGG